MYTNILIPTDGSELAGKAVQHDQLLFGGGRMAERCSLGEAHSPSTQGSATVQ